MSADAETLTIADLGDQLGSQVQTYKALADENLGNMTLKMSLSLRQFVDMSWVANHANISQNEMFKNQPVAQRTLIPAHVKGLAQYTLMGLVNAQFRLMKKQGIEIKPEVAELVSYLPSGPYASMQPIVCNIRDCEFGGKGINIQQINDKYDNPTGVFKVSLHQKHILYVVDGQHRRAGFEQVLDFLRQVNRTYKYPKKGIFIPPGYTDNLISESVHDFWQKVLEGALSRSSIAVEVHLGLDAEQEQQLFVDLNARSKAVGQSFVNSFDHADPVNKFINEDLIDSGVVNFTLSNDDQSDWHKDTGQLKRKDIKQICALLLLGKTASNTATPVIINERRAFGIKFWQTLCSVTDFGSEGARAKTVLRQPVVMKALAKLAHDLGYGTTKLRDESALKNLYTAISDGSINFSHSDPLWQALLLSSKEREAKFPGISNYVHVPVGTNLDAGTWDEDNKWVRFGSRHNDIFPRLGDVVRHKLSLEPRPTVTNAIAKEDIDLAINKVFDADSDVKKTNLA